MPATTATPATTPAGHTYLVDPNGFPVEQCWKCDGKGTLTHYGHVYGGVCFTCKGAGYPKPRGKVAALAAEFYSTVRKARECTPGVSGTVNPDGTRTYAPGAEIGDVIRPYGGGEWKTIAAITPTRRVMGESYANHNLAGIALDTLVTFTDGTTKMTGGNSLWKRQPNQEALVALRDRLAGEARKLYERTVDRREAKAAKMAAAH